MQRSNVIVYTLLTITLLLPAKDAAAIEIRVTCPFPKSAEASVIQSLRVEQGVKNGVVLRLEDGACVMIEENSLRLSKTIEDLLEDVSRDQIIPIPSANFEAVEQIVKVWQEKGPRLQYDKIVQSLSGKTWRQVTNFLRAVSYLDVRLSERYLGFDRALDVGIDFIRTVLLGEDLRKITKMNQGAYQSYKNSLAPLDTLNRDTGGLVVSQLLKSSIHRYDPPVSPRNISVAEAQLAALASETNLLKEQLPTVLKNSKTLLDAWNTSSHGDKFRFSAITWPGSCKTNTEPEKQDERYVDNQDGTVKDLCTGLTWEKDVSPTRFSWQSATSYCEKLVKANAYDWRLPDRFELESLTDKTATGQKLNKIFSNDTRDHLWSSNLVDTPNRMAWGVGFQGVPFISYKTSQKLRVRCVR